MSKAVATKDSKDNVIIPFDNVPDHLRGLESTGLEGLGQSDFKIPRIKRLDPKSPEVTTFAGEAIPGHFWHTGINKDLGTEFLMVPCAVTKRVVVWMPREQGGGIGAMSRDGVNWTQGANQRLAVKLKGVKEPVIWDTGKDVKSSGLLDWGTYNPADDGSGPAAQLSYEYLMWLVEYPELSPVFMGCFRTALANAKQFNTAIAALKKPITSVVVRCFMENKVRDANEWSVPNFQLKGWAPKDIVDKANKIADAAKNYAAAAVPDDEEATVDIEHSKY